MKDILAMHNVYRCLHNVPMLAWHEDLAISAQKWADRGQFQHSPNDARFVWGTQAGENIAWGYATGNQTVKAWYCEIDCTEPYGLAAGAADSKNPDEPIGHYTQVVWASTLYIGCGKGSALIDGTSAPLWVCQYSEAGNYGGRYEANVLSPTMALSHCPLSDYHADASTCPRNEHCEAPKPAPKPKPTPPPARKLLPAKTPAAVGEVHKRSPSTGAAPITQPPATRGTIDDDDERIVLKFSVKLQVANRIELLADPTVIGAIQNVVGATISVSPGLVSVTLYEHADTDKVLAYVQAPSLSSEINDKGAALSSMGEYGLTQSVVQELSTLNSNSVVFDVCGCT